MSVKVVRGCRSSSQEKKVRTKFFSRVLPDISDRLRYPLLSMEGFRGRSLREASQYSRFIRYGGDRTVENDLDESPMGEEGEIDGIANSN